MSSRCHRIRTIAGIMAALAMAGCNRERRDLRPAPASLVLYNGAASESLLRPGGTEPQPPVANPDQGSAYDISEGQRLFNWYNCSGCHANGGGGIGPPLIKQVWIYGGEPANIFDTIMKGRPNGMPTWGQKIPEYQVWQLVSWVLAMNHREPQAATPTRTDTIEQNSGTILDHPERLKPR